MSSTLAILEIQDPGNLENTIITIKGAHGTILLERTEFMAASA